MLQHFYSTHIKAEKYRQFGFSFKLINPVHWFQFADDAAVVTTQESENQHLLNRFSVWCQWSNMFIPVEKCSTFGIRKASTKSVQFLPKLFINSMLIPTVKISESFLYLGRYFSFHMSDDSYVDSFHMSEITSLIKDLMSNIDSKPLHPKNKLLLYSRYVQYIPNLGKRKYRFCGKQLHSSMARNTNFRNTLLRFHDSK